MANKCKSGFSRKGDKCVKNNSNGIFRVSYEIPTSRGFDKKGIKIFKSLQSADKEFNKRLREFKSDIKKDNFEGGEGVILEDIKTDIRVRSRIVDEDGEIQNFDRMR